MINKKYQKALLMMAMIACYAMIFLDESGIAVALPMIQQNLGMTNHAGHWVINSYLLSLSILLLLGGKLSDIYGHRKIFIVGIFIFIIASFITGAATKTWVLILGSALQGVGASLLIPCITVLIRLGFPENQFGKAFGLVLGFSNFFYAAGPFLGGAITEFLNWRWFFWINIPIGILCLILTFLSVKKDAIISQKHFSDLKGLFIFIFAFTSFIIATMQGAEWGWLNSWIIGFFVVSIIGFFLFVKIELRTEIPLLDMHLFQNKTFLAGNIVLFCASLCLTSMVFWALWMQVSLRLTPATVGLALLPATVAFIFLPSCTGAWLDKFGARSPMLAGSVLTFFGLLWISAVIYLQNYVWLLPGLILFGIGIPLVIPSSIMNIMNVASKEHGGAASGIFTTVRQGGLTIGIALLSAVISSYNNFHIKTLLESSTLYHNLSVNQVNLFMLDKNHLAQLSLNQLNLLSKKITMIYTFALTNGMMIMTMIAFIAIVTVFFFIKKRNSG